MASEHFATVMVEAFIAAVEEGLDLVPVVSDSTSTAKIAPFMQRFPERVINVGIAEQSLVGVAAGLALGGKIAATCNARAVPDFPCQRTGQGRCLLQPGQRQNVRSQFRHQLWAAGQHPSLSG